MAATATVDDASESTIPKALIAAVQAIGVGVLLAILMGIGGYIFAPSLLEFMHATRGPFTRGPAGADRSRRQSAIVMLFLINGIFRGRVTRPLRCAPCGCQPDQHGARPCSFRLELLPNLV